MLSIISYSEVYESNDKELISQYNYVAQVLECPVEQIVSIDEDSNGFKELYKLIDYDEVRLTDKVPKCPYRLFESQIDVSRIVILDDAGYEVIFFTEDTKSKLEEVLSDE